MLILLFALGVSCACAETVVKFYMTEFKRDIHTAVQVVNFTSLDSSDKPIILWNRTDPQSYNKRRVKVKNNVWKISNLTQADSGYYNFMLKSNVVMSRIRLLVKENVFHFDVIENEPVIITYPQFGGSWTVIFKPVNGKDQETVMKNGRLVLEFHRFTQRINIRDNGIEIENVELKDSGTFEFRDPQGNLAMAVHLIVSTGVPTERNDAIITYIAVCIGAVIMGVCCCCGCCWCKKSCCKKDSSAPQTEAPAPAVYYHDTVPPAQVPSYSGPAYPSVYPQQPGYQPVNIYPPLSGIDMNPPQPGISMYPPQLGTNISPPQFGINLNHPQPATNVNPPQPATDVSHPQPATGVNPPQPATDVKPPQTEVGPPTDQGPPAAPTFSSEFLSDVKPTFELKGFSSANPLSSDTPSYDVHNLDKLNFL